jgi:membrane protein DedA with SNARE-associated domain
MAATQSIINNLGTLSYVGIFGVSILSNVVIPVPEEVILLALGYLAGTGKLNIVILIPIAMAGLFLSDIVMYALSKKNNRFITLFYEKFFSNFVSRHPWIEANPRAVIFFSRFLVQLRFLGPFIAGQLKVSTKKFITYDMLALIIYVPLLTILGKVLHNDVLPLIDDVDEAKDIILVIFGGIVATSLIRFIYELSQVKKKIKN